VKLQKFKAIGRSLEDCHAYSDIAQQPVRFSISGRHPFSSIMLKFRFAVSEPAFSGQADATGTSPCFSSDSLQHGTKNGASYGLNWLTRLALLGATRAVSKNIYFWDALLCRACNNNISG